MKNFKSYFRFVLVVLLTLSVSCNDLSQNPKSFSTPENFFTTQEQVNATFAGSMSNLWGFWNGYAYRGFLNFAHDDQLESRIPTEGNLNIPPNFGSGMWAAHYNSILNINTVISSIKQGSLVNVSSDKIDELMGEAKFLRAFNYFMLVRMFGGLPLITEEDKEDLNKISRSPVTDVYDLIVSDFTEAANKLPPTRPSEFKGRPTKGAAKALLAKAYLTMATAPLNQEQYYQNAADLAEEVIQGPHYSLVQDIDNVFSLETEYGPEMIWSFQSNQENPTTAAKAWYPGVLNGWYDFSINPAWEQKYPDQPRKDAYIMTEDNGVHYSNYSVGKQTPNIRKFMYDPQENYVTNESIINMPIIRYADVLLIFAEAENMAQGGPTPAAVEAINKVIDRANGYQSNPSHPRLTTSMSQDEFDEAVIEERNLELCFELGDRWFDLVRKRILEEKVDPAKQANFSEADYLFPIPEKDIRLNPSLEQNPGY